MDLRLVTAADFVRSNTDRRALLAVLLKPQALADEHWEPSPSQLKSLEHEMALVREWQRGGL
jgi:hypothetical protein